MKNFGMNVRMKRMPDLYAHIKTDEDYFTYNSKVYAIDPIGHKFLVIKNSKYFKWVDTKDCEFIKEE